LNNRISHKYGALVHYLKVAGCVLCVAILSGCFQAQLNGPVAGADITVTDLTDTNQIHASATTFDRDLMIALRGADKWEAYGPFGRLLLLGVFQLDVALLDEQTFYLVTASGGEDTDIDRNNNDDAQYTPVAGQWRAIMTGAQLQSQGPKVSALTEAVYQWLQPHLVELTAEQLATNLDRAAVQLVDDVDEDGNTNWNDLLLWSQLFNHGQLRGNLAILHELADDIVSGDSQEHRRYLAQTLLGLEVTTTVEVSADSYFEDHVAGSVLEPACLNCHVTGGLSGHTRLVFSNDGAADQNAANELTLRTFLTSFEGAPEYLLSKVQGVSHGGLTQFTSLSEEFGFLETYISLVTDDQGGPASEETAAFWSGVNFADSRTTLRRAAILFTGRIPTDAEYAGAAAGGAGLRSALRNLRSGDAFHEFLVRGANDRLHTDAFINGQEFPLACANLSNYPVLANKQVEFFSNGNEGTEAFEAFENLLIYGLARSPLELIAYVVETDSPYTEILSAEYMMANPQMSEVFRTGLDHGTDDPRHFLPGLHRGQILFDDALVTSEFDASIGTEVFSHSGFIDYPHAGVLNSMAFLARYPTTETNRNRARARWTYFHFLGIDIEKSAPRSNDPVALADTDNPTLNNPACTVCHVLHDPVAGTFQNYSDEGYYRGSGGGLDSLPENYKFPEAWQEIPEELRYQEGDTWFRDMRTPGIDGNIAPDADNSLNWLARQITADPRFDIASIKFWWPAVMGTEVLEAPEVTSDIGYQQLLRAFEQQQTDIRVLADNFSAGFNGGLAYNMKDLLVEMAMSGWFRADSMVPDSAVGRERELETAGTRRLLTPEELENKTTHLLGVGWMEFPDDRQLDGLNTFLVDRYLIYYGGINSIGVKGRARELTALMFNVVTRMAIEMSCQAAIYDFQRPDQQRLLFGGISSITTPTSEGQQRYLLSPDYAARTNQQFRLSLTAGDKLLQIIPNNGAYDPDNDVARDMFIANVAISYQGQELLNIFGPDLGQVEGIPGRVHEEEIFPDDWREVAWVDAGDNPLTIPFTVPVDAEYEVNISAWGSRLLDDVPVDMSIVVSNPDPYGDSVGSSALRDKIQELHALMLGEDLALGDPEIEATYQLLVETWQDRIANLSTPGRFRDYPTENCEMPSSYYDLDFEDSSRLTYDEVHMKASWAAVLIYLMTDYKYLHE
jgi:hypothetical protein